MLICGCKDSDFSLFCKHKNDFLIFFHRIVAVGAGFEPAVQLPVRQFSKLLVSASHPSHQCPKNVGAKITIHAFLQSNFEKKNSFCPFNPFLRSDYSLKIKSFSFSRFDFTSSKNSLRLRAKRLNLRFERK